MEKKQCLYCGKHKLISKFSTSQRKYLSRCKKCHALLQRERNKKRKALGLCPRCGNPSKPNHSMCNSCSLKINNRCKTRNKIHRKKMKQKAINFLGGFCKACGTGYTSLAVYDFHHEVGKKEVSLGHMLVGASWDRIKKELDKCILLCANCHRIFHNKEV